MNFVQQVKAWLQNVLPGSRFIPPAGRRGRKIAWEECQHQFSLIEDYEDLLDELKKHLVRRQGNENHEDWKGLLVGVVEQVWRESDAPVALTANKNKQGT